MTRAARAQEFAVPYTRHLEACVRRRPDEYCYTLEEVPDVVRRMTLAFTAGTYNADGLAIRATCRELGLKPSRRALERFFNS
jgi:hypothetical protein